MAKILFINPSKYGVGELLWFG